MKRILVEALPDDPIAAAGLFYQNWLDLIERTLVTGQDVLIAMPVADYPHEEWRRAAVAMLARQYAPLRVNLVAGEREALERSADFLARAPGVTGQYLRVCEEGVAA